MFVHLQDGQLLRHVDLGGGQTDPGILVHGLDHIVDQALKLRAWNDLGGNRPSGSAQHRMPETADFQNSHATLPRTAQRRFRRCLRWGR